VAAAFGTIAVSGGGAALILAAKAIQMFVWEGVFPFGFLFGCVFPLFYYFFNILMEVVRQQRRIPIEPHPEQKNAPLSPEQIAPIHEAIFAGQTFEAIKQYRAATGAKGNKALTDITRMEEELKEAHPEKFSAEVLNRPHASPGRYAWLSLGSTLLIGLLLFFMPPDRADSHLFFIGYGIVLGAGIRAMSYGGMARWKRAHREMRRWIKWLAWILVACFGLALTSIMFALITNPKVALDPAAWLFVLSLVAGWLLVHLTMKRRKA
jgi:hypothetical protein